MAFKKLNKDAKKIWIAALKSGVYKQTMGTLKDEAGYCCLGVAQAEFCKLAKVKPNFKSGNGALFEPGNSGQSIGAYHWLGLSKSVHYKLTLLNDSDGFSFKEIAAWIKKNL